MSIAAGTRDVSHRRSRVVWAVAAYGVIAVAVLAVVYAVLSPATSALDLVGGIAALVSLLAFVLSGAVIVSRQPGNVIGWLLMIPGLALPLAEVSTRWLASLDPPPTSVTPGLWLLLWADGWSWVLLVFPIFHLLLTFPSGRLLSARWRWAVALEVAMIGTIVGLSAFGADMSVLVDDVRVWTVPNPIGVFHGDPMASWFGALWALGLFAITALSTLAIVVRFRRGSVDERQQLKWPAAGALLFGVLYGAAAVQGALNQDSSLQMLLGFGLAAIPISVAVAVLRYRLYEIDRIVSRGIGWTIVTGTLVAVFVLAVVALQTALSGLTQGQTIAVAASTLLAFALFQPLRRRIQHAVDRRFDRARYDGRRTADAFAERLRGEVEIEVVAADLEATIEVAVRPATQGLWLRGAGR